MKRRLLLTQCGLAGLLPMLPSGRARAARRRDAAEVDVLVIGAGMAGLAAASHLRDAGLQVQVLDARSRLGGRVWTSRAWPDLPMDLGASWIHGAQGNPMTALARAAGVKTVATSYERALAFDAAGKVIRGGSLRHFETVQERAEAALKAAGDAKRDQSARNAVAKLRREWQDDPQSLRELEFVLNSTLEQEFGGSAADLSSYWMDDGEGFDGEDRLFPDGYGQLIAHLARGISVQLNDAVQTIDWQHDLIEVRTTQRRWTAEQVVVTVPLGVLKANSIVFTPGLPKRKQEAIEGLGMGLLNKCALRFENVFWPDDFDWLEFVGERTGEWAEWISFARAIGAPVLLGFHAADQARALERRSDQETIAAAMRVLRHLFGADTPDPVAAQITRWARDPFAFGAYSYNPVGVHPRIRDDLAESLEDRLHFAGEATTRAHFGTVHGAYLSGQRAALAVLATLA
ncbi:amine oxidase [Ahniella affigens]|uniref:Tryptophan 2-monooxygenase n=1 Tax=Ahniella affigens TaxID=2021234 RepID=A0A2P1PQB2_9GAMM|nr:FAD-dependent oxidoreductase [Ahniella affigens]AVP97037.1 amine oxidase [Ahniella affigens]